MLKSPSPGRVVIAEPFDERGAALLRESGIDVVSCVGTSSDELHEALRNARGLIVRSETRVDDCLLAYGERLDVVARAGVGVDAIDVEAATRAGIVVINTPGANTIAATELTFALLLAAMRNVPQANARVHAGGWERTPFIGHELYGKTIGIVGFGRIGSSVATRAKAFGMNVIACDPFIPASRAGMLDIELVEFETLLATANVVTLHVPLTAQTRGMIDALALSRMRDDAVLINCSRGAVVDLDALLATLDAGRLNAVALDVVQQEPPPPGSASSRALVHPRIIATPHIGGSTHEALERIAMELATDVVRVLQGRPAGGAVNAPAYRGGDAQQLNGVVELAFRMGAMLPQLFDEALRHEMVLVLHGDLEDVEAEPLIAAVLAGALPFVSDRRLSTVNARAIADELGVRISVAREGAVAPFRSALTLLAGDHRVVGTVLPTGPRIVRIDGFELDAVAEGTAIVTRHRDVPGMVGHIGTILGAAHVNISTMQVARTEPGGDAMMLLEVDLGDARGLAESIGAVDGVQSVRILHL